jgi:hypothetical protein
MVREESHWPRLEPERSRLAATKLADEDWTQTTEQVA